MYLQIMEHIKQRIAVGDWQAGFELPSIRQLAIDTRVSVITIKRAYLELEREGVILTQHGKGSTVASTPPPTTHIHEQNFEQHLEQIVRLGKQLKLNRHEFIRRLETAYTLLEEEQA